VVNVRGVAEGRLGKKVKEKFKSKPCRYTMEDATEVLFCHRPQ